MQRTQDEAKHTRHEKDWYDSVSGTYASKEGGLDSIERLLDDMIAKQNFNAILELACGTGRFTNGARASTVVGTDLSRLMLSRVKPTGAELVQSDIWALPFRAETFDGILCMHALGEHIPLAFAMKEAWRVAASESVFIFTTIPHRTRLSILIKTLMWKLGRKTDYALSRYQASSEDVRRIASSIGFVVTETMNVQSGLNHLLVVCRKGAGTTQFTGVVPGGTKMPYSGARLVGKRKLSQRLLRSAGGRFPRSFHSLRKARRL